MLIRLLERVGHTCTPATNGKEAVEAVEADLTARNMDEAYVPIDTILMDYEMPLMNGPDATYEIRKLGFTGNIFGVTGNLLGDDVDYFLDKGANQVLGKPISMAILDNAWIKEQYHGHD